jgi:hypothetical protein
VSIGRERPEAVIGRWHHERRSTIYLEHVPSQLNQGDSLGAKDERVYRH